MRGKDDIYVQSHQCTVHILYSLVWFLHIYLVALKY